MADVRFTAQAADRAEYESWFTNHGGNLANDAISVDGATAFFRQSGLPTPVLSAVWAAANRSTNPASLRFIDFAAAANLLLQIARGQLASPPNALPPKFFQDVEVFAKPKPAPAKSTSNDFDPFGPGSAPTSSAPASAAPRSAAGGANTTSLSALLFDDAPGASVATLTPHATTSHDASRAGGPSPISLHRTGPPPLTPLQPQSTGTSNMLGGGSAATLGRAGTGLPPARSMTANAPPMIPAQRPGSAAAAAPTAASASSTSTAAAAWAVPPEKQQLYGGYFADVDVGKKGFATANECYDFFLKSNLPPADLRHVWTLVTALDPHPSSQSQLKRDEFILAMHLIMERLAGHAIPDPLPTDLIPPARRTASPPQMMASAAKNASIVSLAPTPPNPVAPASFDDIIGGGAGGGSGAPAAAASALSGIGLLAGFGATATAGRAGSSATPVSATTRAPALAAAPSASMAGAPGSFSSFPALNLGSGAPPSAAVSQLPEAQELAQLTSKTEALSLHRIETTNSINALSIEKQNLTIRLGQVKAAHDAEQQLLDSLKSTFETERKAVDALKDEVLALERARQEVIAEKASLNDQMAAHRQDAESARNRIVALNFEINTMRQELAGLRAQAARERENAEFNAQSVQNIEETKGAIASQVEDERRKRANMPPPPVPAQRPTQVVAAVAAVAAHATGGSTVSAGTSRSTAAAPVAAHATGGSTFSRPTPAAAPVFAHTTGGSTFSATSGRSPVGHGLGSSLAMPSGTATSASLTGSVSFDPFATTETAPAPTAGAAPAPRPPSLDQLRSTSPTATSIQSFEQAFPSPSKLGTVVSPSAVAAIPTPAAPARMTSDDDVPDEYKNEFDAFAFNFPPVSPPGGAAAGSPSAASAAAHDPFAAMGAAPAPAMPASSSAAASATGAAASTTGAAAAWGTDFDPFGAPGPAPATASATPAPVSSAAPFDDPFAALSATAPTSSSAAFGAPAAVDDAFDPFAAPSAVPGAAAPPLPGRPVGTPPPADAVAAVMALGFSHDQAVSALKRYDNDPGKASNYLIDEAAKQ
ncbi:hypothetical protein GGF31_004435 [Allomyces arbusculus]|nr:hypothetical protein GGF31_004435 [Allomyces arbusculus]